MNHDENKPDVQTWIEPELEARIVAWVAGEASAFESAELERLVGEKPELAIFKRRIEAAHGLVAVAVRPDREPLRLSPERRAKLLQTLTEGDGPAKAGAPKRVDAPAVFPTYGAKQQRRKRWRRFGTIAAGLMLGVFFSTLIKYSGENYERTPMPSVQYEGQQRREVVETEERRKEPQPGRFEAIYDRRNDAPKSVSRERADFSEAPAALAPLDLEKQQILSATNALPLSDGSPDRGAVVLSPYEVTADRDEGYAASNPLAGSRLSTSSARLSGQGNYDGPGALRAGQPPPGLDLALGQAGRPTSPPARRSFTGENNKLESDRPMAFFGTTSPAAPETAGSTPAEQRQTNFAAGMVDAKAKSRALSKDEVVVSDQEVIQLSPFQITDPTGQKSNALQSILAEPSVAASPPPQSELNSQAKEMGEIGEILSYEKKVAAPLPKLIEANSADLAVEVSAAKQPVSTFSLHVSDVSFRLAQAALARGELPEPDRIRPEEFYNAFDYGDPAPAMAEKVFCRVEQSAHPMVQQRNLVRIAMKVPSVGRGASQPLYLTVMLDTSGSMEREDRAPAVQQAMNALASLLGPNDRLTVIGFARQPRLLVDQLPGDKANEALTTIAHTPSEGGTDLEAALKLASELALRNQVQGAQNRIVLLTDGAANLGNADPAQLASSVEALRQKGIAFDACGVGLDGMNDAMLERLTRKGDGRYYVLNTPEAADQGFARQLAGAFRPAAENVKVQVRFNQARVGAYRLIGFEQHRLKEEDFRNDKVDAAELAADEAAVAVYQVETLPQGEGDLGEVYVRFRDASNGNMIERSWNLPYDPQAAAFDRATPAMQLAGVATLLAEKIRGGAVADTIKLDELAPVVNALRGHYRQNPRVQELVTMYEQLRRLMAE